jgi:hypothetical protein
MPRLRSPLALAALAVSLAVAALAPATAGAATKVTVTPTSGTAGDRVVIRGTGFGTTEFCRPRATLRVLGVAIARAVINPNNGSFATRWVIPEAIGPGPRRITVRQNCESGKDGSLVLVKGTGWVFIR